MRHRVSGKRLGRTTAHRKAMRRNMAVSLFTHGAIRTTESKAKELRAFVERIITIARQGSLHARRRVLSMLGDRLMFDEDGEPAEQTVVQKLFDEIAPRYDDRPGGYTRIIRLSDRRIGDAGVQVLLQLVEEAPAQIAEQAAGRSRRKRRASKRHEAAAVVADETSDEERGEADADEPQDTGETGTEDETRPADDEARDVEGEGEEAEPKEQ